MQQDISYEYADMEMYGDEIIFTGNRSCNILRTNGHDKFDYHFEQRLMRCIRHQMDRFIH